MTQGGSQGKCLSPECGTKPGAASHVLGSTQKAKAAQTPLPHNRQEGACRVGGPLHGTGPTFRTASPTEDTGSLWLSPFLFTTCYLGLSLQDLELKYCFVTSLHF